MSEFRIGTGSANFDVTSGVANFICNEWDNTQVVRRYELILRVQFNPITKKWSVIESQHQGLVK